jgi:ribosomal protein S18 acetylase RimI-like enzyme
MPVITQLQPNEIDTIFEFYEMAITFQKTRFHKTWQSFDRELIRTELAEKRQWKIMEGNDIACIFAITYNDPFIWAEKDQDPAIYIHRIVTHPDYHGRHYVKKIVEWAKHHAAETGKKFIRMDTWGDNEKLIAYYQSCGFNFLGVITPERSKLLPEHYSAINLSLFEIPL